jgi:hypothetical protein
MSKQKQIKNMTFNEFNEKTSAVFNYLIEDDARSINQQLYYEQVLVKFKHWDKKSAITKGKDAEKKIKELDKETKEKK